MLIDERYRMIMQKINAVGSVRVEDLAKEFNVSDETVRRDINMLDKSLSLRKVRGGAVSVVKNIIEESYIKRVCVEDTLINKIGKYSAGLINSNDIVFLDVGTTIDELAKNVYGVENVTFITNSISALTILISKRNNNNFTGNIYFLGGEVASNQYYTTGETVVTQLKNFWADKVFFSATSISINGLYDYSVQQANIAKHLLKHSTLNYCLLTSAKFNTNSLYKIESLDKIHNIITDDEIKIETTLKSTLEYNDIKLHIIGD